MLEASTIAHSGGGSPDGSVEATPDSTMDVRLKGSSDRRTLGRAIAQADKAMDDSLKSAANRPKDVVEAAAAAERWVSANGRGEHSTDDNLRVASDLLKDTPVQAPFGTTTNEGTDRWNIHGGGSAGQRRGWNNGSCRRTGVVAKAAE